MFLVDHGIWMDTGAWRECIDTVLKVRMEEANKKALRRS